jgi:hypothetical protein
VIPPLYYYTISTALLLRRIKSPRGLGWIPSRTSIQGPPEGYRLILG